MYRRTWQDWSGQVAFPFVSAGHSGCPVRIRVLPVLQELLRFAQQDLFNCVKDGAVRNGLDPIPAVGGDHGRPCSLRKGIGYKLLVRATPAGVQPSQGPASRTACRATCKMSVHSSWLEGTDTH
jgi:hypothetical protein